LKARVRHKIAALEEPGAYPSYDQWYRDWYDGGYKKPSKEATVINALNGPYKPPEPEPLPTVDPKNAERAAELWQHPRYNKFVKGKIAEALGVEHLDHHPQSVEIEELVWGRVLDKIHQFKPRGETDDEKRKTTQRWLQKVTHSAVMDWVKSKKSQELQAGAIFEITSKETSGALQATKKTPALSDYDEL